MTTSTTINIPPDELIAIIEKTFRKIIAESTPAAPLENQRLIGDKAAAAYLGCSVLTIGNLRRSGEAPHHQFGRKYYYLSTELDQAFKVKSRRFGENRGAK